MPRKAREIYTNFPHHVVQRGNNRKRVFVATKDKNRYLSLLKKNGFECGCKIYAYCLMSNHIHLLIEPLFEDSLSKAMQKLNISYTQYVNKKYQRTGRLWSSRFYSSPITKEKYLWAVCRYIEQNPVRAKLTNKATEYIYSSARVSCGLKKSDFIVPIWKDYLDIDEYKRLLSEPLEAKKANKIRLYLKQGNLLE
jgi:putative transposase